MSADFAETVSLTETETAVIAVRAGVATLSFPDDDRLAPMPLFRSKLAAIGALIGSWSVGLMPGEASRQVPTLAVDGRNLSFRIEARFAAPLLAAIARALDVAEAK